MNESHIELIFSSPLRRAYKTADPLARRKRKAIICVKNLIERGFGVVEGFEENNIETNEQLSKKLILRKTVEENFRPEGGESLTDVYRRVNSFLDFLSKLNLKGMVICVTHGGFLDILYRIIKKEPISSQRKWVIPNGAFFLLELEDKKFKILKWAETNHLRGSEVLDEH